MGTEYILYEKIDTLYGGTQMRRVVKLSTDNQLYFNDIVEYCIGLLETIRMYYGPRGRGTYNNDKIQLVDKFIGVFCDLDFLPDDKIAKVQQCVQYKDLAHIFINLFVELGNHFFGDDYKIFDSFGHVVSINYWAESVCPFKLSSTVEPLIFDPWQYRSLLC